MRNWYRLLTRAAQKRLLGLCLALTGVCSGCGYHVAGHANALPPSIQTIAVLPFTTATVRYKISERLTTSVSRELIQRTKYHVTSEAAGADAVLTGSLVSFSAYPTTFDPVTNRASAVQVFVQFQITLKDKAGKVLYQRPNFSVRERYEVSVDPENYFDESTAAGDRLSRDVANSIVSAILERF